MHISLKNLFNWNFFCSERVCTLYNNWVGHLLLLFNRFNVLLEQIIRKLCILSIEKMQIFHLKIEFCMWKIYSCQFKMIFTCITSFVDIFPLALSSLSTFFLLFFSSFYEWSTWVSFNTRFSLNCSTIALKKCCKIQKFEKKKTKNYY